MGLYSVLYQPVHVNYLPSASSLQILLESVRISMTKSILSREPPTDMFLTEVHNLRSLRDE